MKSKTFNLVLEAWYCAELNRISEGQYGLGDLTRENAIEGLEKRKQRYIKEFKEEK